jgi:micrococcal nuclease
MKRTLGLAALLLASCARETPVNMEKAHVSRIIDGDTIELSTKQKVRLICIDTPERGRPAWRAARDYVKELLLDKDIYMEQDVQNQDGYGRLQRYVYLDEGVTAQKLVSVNEKIVREGYANIYRYPPNVKHCDEYVDSARRARAEGKGLWKIE